MAELISPYKNIELCTKIKIHAHQINNDLYINLKNNLKKKVEKKCNKYGYITKVYKILDHDNGYIVPENLDSSPIFNIRYSCRICVPIASTLIICKIDLMNKVLIKVSNGPIIGIIKINEINKNNFSVNNNKILHKGKDLSIDMYVKVLVIKSNLFSGDKRIIILGKLEDIASKSEINKFYKENFDSEEIQESSLTTNISENSTNESVNINNNYKNL